MGRLVCWCRLYPRHGGRRRERSRRRTSDAISTWTDRGRDLEAVAAPPRQARLVVRAVPPRRTGAGGVPGHGLPVDDRAGRGPRTARARRAGRLLLLPRSVVVPGVVVGQPVR